MNIELSSQSIADSLLGGALIGISASLTLLFLGRIAGISGILNGVLLPTCNNRPWRVAFLVGLISGGAALNFYRPDFFSHQFDLPSWRLALAGLLVGFGTVRGTGCTSGHGVCGVSRFSMESIAATAAFMAAGILTILGLRFAGVHL